MAEPEDEEDDDDEEEVLVGGSFGPGAEEEGLRRAEG